jgi:tetratricopeptide (TPR) repeat protein
MRGQALVAQALPFVDRIATFKTFIAQNPADPFPRYGLAMEYKNQQKLEESASAFAELREAFPDYVPQYLMGGNVLVALGRKAEAASIFKQGIEAATRRQDFHAKGELEGALMDLNGDLD